MMPISAATTAKPTNYTSTTLAEGDLGLDDSYISDDADPFNYDSTLALPSPTPVYSLTAGLVNPLTVLTNMVNGAINSGIIGSLSQYTDDLSRHLFPNLYRTQRYEAQKVEDQNSRETNGYRGGLSEKDQATLHEIEDSLKRYEEKKASEIQVSDDQEGREDSTEQSTNCKGICSAADELNSTIMASGTIQLDTKIDLHEDLTGGDSLQVKPTSGSEQESIQEQQAKEPQDAGEEISNQIGNVQGSKTVPLIIPQTDMNNADPHPTVLTPSVLDSSGPGTGAVNDFKKAETGTEDSQHHSNFGAKTLEPSTPNPKSSDPGLGNDGFNQQPGTTKPETNFMILESDQRSVASNIPGHSPGPTLRSDQLRFDRIQGAQNAGLTGASHNGDEGSSIKPLLGVLALGLGALAFVYGINYAKAQPEVRSAANLLNSTPVDQQTQNGFAAAPSPKSPPPLYTSEPQKKRIKPNDSHIF
jgi:hypothetical protein